MRPGSVLLKCFRNVASGDLKQTFTVKSKGEVAALADTINNMTSTLATFAEQVSTVAREVGVEGRLGGQADVPGAAEWLRSESFVPWDEVRRVLVLGDMKELGPSSERYHREIGQYVASAKAFDQLICVGAEAGWIAEAAAACGFASENIVRFNDARSASMSVPPSLREGDLVLLKGSRSVHLEQVARAITQGEQMPVRMVAS